jgi:diguanylate cyclase (GGDEF)-like protein
VSVTRSRRPLLHPAVRSGAVVLLAAVLHFALARVSHQLSSAAEPSPFWIPAGVDVALAVLLGPWAAAGVLAGDMLACLAHGAGPGTSLGEGIGNGLAAVIGALLVARLAHPRGLVARRRDVLAIATAVAPAAAAVSATFGVASLVLAGSLPTGGFAGAWRTWFVSNGAGIVVLTPALLVMAHRPWRLPTLAHAGESLALIGALVLALFPWAAGHGGDAYLVFPVIVWAALRFGLPGAAAVSLLGAALDLVLAAQWYGASHAPDIEEPLLHAQGFMAVSTLTGLLLAVVRDEREAAVGELARRALHDPLTGLPNRALLADRLEQALARSREDGTMLALLLVDLDEFKNVNDSLGHHTGDQLLTQVAPRLRAAVRPQDTVARFGGDEFVVLCEGLAGPWEAEDVAHRLAGAWSEPFPLGEDDVYISGSTGIAVARAGRADRAALLREADAAMYRAKDRGRGHAELYDDAMRAQAYERLRLERDLRRALADGDIAVHYQPIVDLETGRPIAVEALSRWTHPERGHVSPAAFIPVAEESGLIADLGRDVLRDACAQVARWRAELPGAEHLQLSVNVSARQITRGELLTQVGQALREAGLPPSALALEVTESALMEETDAPGPVLASLRALGVQIVLDDFGTGYSSLSYLRRFPLDGLKLDRSFVDGLGRQDAAAVVAAIIGMGTTLGLVITAEGIETRDQAERLRDLGCPRGQGYVLARPLPPQDAAAFLADGLRRRPALRPGARAASEPPRVT